jgi:hypothetical protein
MDSPLQPTDRIYSFGCIGLLAASLAGIFLGTRGLYGDPERALGPRASTAGILVPGLLGHDVFNLVLGLPTVLLTWQLTRRGSRAALLLRPSALFYMLLR